MNIAIVGCGFHGGVVLEILRAEGRHHVVGFLDDDASKHGKDFRGVPVLGAASPATASALSIDVAIVAIGSNPIRSKVATLLRSNGIPIVSAVHPSVVVASDAVVGLGTVLCPGAIIVTGTTIGEDVIVNTGTSIDHDSWVGSGAQLAPGVRTAGCVRIGEGAFVGLGTCLGPGVSIGPGSIIGAGSVVLKSVPPHVFAVGTPAHVVRALGQEVNWGRILGGGLTH